MENKTLSVFAPDERHGVMNELAPGELADFAVANRETVPRPCRVLVADDSETDRFLTIQQLDKAQPFVGNMTIASARDGAEALEKIRSSQFTLVVLDWNMPHLDGGQVLRTMREGGVRVPVVVVSGRRREDISSDLESMAATFLNKDELDPINFRSAIAASILMQDARSSVGVRPGNHLRLQA